MGKIGFHNHDPDDWAYDWPQAEMVPLTPDQEEILRQCVIGVAKRTGEIEARAFYGDCLSKTRE